jgi:hypothetical protein
MAKRKLPDKRRTADDYEICSIPSNKLAREFGNGFSQPNLTRIIRLAVLFLDRRIVSALSRQSGQRGPNGRFP